MEKNSGVTFISLALSNFLHSKLGKKTAYIELNTTNQIQSLSPKQNEKYFSYMGFDIFPSITVTSLWEILCLNYDYFVLDMGVLNTYTAKEFSKCEHRFLVCSLSKWKIHQTLEKVEKFCQQTYIPKEHVTVLNNLKMQKSTFALFSTLPVKVISFPFIPNPFQLKPDTFHVFHQILERK